MHFASVGMVLRGTSEEQGRCRIRMTWYRGPARRFVAWEATSYRLAGEVGDRSRNPLAVGTRLGQSCGLLPRPTTRSGTVVVYRNSRRSRLPTIAIHRHLHTGTTDRSLC